MADKSFLEFVTGQTATSKHLQGKHDQKSHGRRGAATASRTDRKIASEKRSEVKVEARLSKRANTISEKLRKVTNPKDSDFVKLDGIRDRVDRLSKTLRMDEIGTQHLRAGNARESWNKLRPRITETLASIRSNISGQVYTSSELRMINALFDDIDAVMKK